MRQLRTSFRTALVAMAVVGFLAVALGEKSFVFVAAAVVVAPLAWVVGTRREVISLSEKQFTWIALAGALFAFYDFRYLSQGTILAGSHFLAVVQTGKLLQRKRTRDHWTIFLVAVAHMVVGAFSTIDAAYLVLLALFSAAACWALMVFQLERSLAGAGAEATDILDSRTCRRQLMGLTALILLVGSVFTVLFFVFCPRIPARTEGFPSIAGAQSVTGFGESVSLGEMGDILSSSAPVMHISLKKDGAPIYLPAEGLYWRGVALSFYDGRRWHRQSPADWRRLDAWRYRVPFRKGPRLAADDPARQRLVTQEIRLEPLDTRTLFGLATIQAMDGGPELRSVHYRPRDESFATTTPRLRPLQYEVTSLLPDQDIGTLSRTPVSDSGVSDLFDSPELRQYSELAEEVGPRVRRLARQIADSVGSPTSSIPQKNRYTVAAAVADYLRRNYGYTLQLRPTPGAEPVEDFLFRLREGHCEYFAASMVVLLRALGVPTRMVNGFKGGEWNQLGGWYVVHQSDAHSWVEVHFPGSGWVRFDPSPPWTSRPRPLAGPLGWVKQVWDYVEGQWFVYGVLYTPEKQRELFVWLREHGAQVARSTRATLARHWAEVDGAVDSILSHVPLLGRLARGSLRPLVKGLAGVVALLVSLGGLRRLRRHWSGRLGHPQQTWPPYRTLLKKLRRLGYEKRPVETAREFVDSVAKELGQVADPARELIWWYYGLRFGGHEPPAEVELRLRQFLANFPAR